MPKDKTRHAKQRPPSEHAVETDRRLFVAIPLPDAVKALVDGLIARFEGNEWPIRWIGSESAHLTLHFLGATAPERAELLRLGFSAPIASLHAFTLVTGRLGVFPDRRDPRVLWLGLNGETSALEALHHGLGKRLTSLGFEIESQRFHPHITLGRLREQANGQVVTSIRTALDDPAIAAVLADAAERFTVDRVILYRSLLKGGATRHDPIGTYRLATQRA